MAIEIFGSKAKLARATGLKRSTIAKWKDPLTRYCEDRVIAACVRQGRPIPAEIFGEIEFKAKRHHPPSVIIK